MTSLLLDTIDMNGSYLYRLGLALVVCDVGCGRMYIEYVTRLDLHDVNSGMLQGNTPVVLGCRFYFHGANSVCLSKCMFVLYQTSERERESCVFYKFATFLDYVHFKQPHLHLLRQNVNIVTSLIAHQFGV